MNNNGTKGAPVMVAGAGRGGTATAEVLPNVGQKLGTELEPIIVDPVPHKANRLAQQLRLRGQKAHAVQGTIDNLDPPKFVPMVMNIDAPEPTARAIYKTLGTQNPISQYGMFDHPVKGLTGIQIQLGADEAEEKILVAEFFKEMAKYQTRGGSDPMIGGMAPPENLYLEAMVRKMQQQHLQSSLAKAAGGLTSNHEPVELILNGVERVPMRILDHRGEELATKTDLVEEVMDTNTRPLVANSPLVVLEMGQKGMLFHFANFQNGRLVLERQPEDVYQRILALHRERKAQHQLETERMNQFFIDLNNAVRYTD